VASFIYMVCVSPQSVFVTSFINQMCVSSQSVFVTSFDIFIDNMLCYVMLCYATC